MLKSNHNNLCIVSDASFAASGQRDCFHSEIDSAIDEKWLCVSYEALKNQIFAVILRAEDKLF